MEALNQRPGRRTEEAAKADSFKQFVSTRRGAYTVAAVAATLGGLVLLVFINRTRTTSTPGSPRRRC